MLVFSRSSSQAWLAAEAKGWQGPFMLRRLLLALMLFLLLAPLPGSQLPTPPVNKSKVIVTRAVAGVSPGLKLGALQLVEAWELNSLNPKFGGISGMALVGPRRFLMVSDTGDRFRFSLGGTGAILRLNWDSLIPLSHPLSRKRFLDAEAVTYDPVTGRSWVAFEGTAQMWRFGPAGLRQGRHTNRVMFEWPANGGGESLARLPDRRFLSLSESVTNNGRREGVIFSGDPVQRISPHRRFFYDDAGLSSPTDVAALPDGRILILHRRIRLSPLFNSHLAIADPRRLTRDGVLKSKKIATISHPALSENYEGIAVEQARDGVYLWMVSDNNLNHWQATRLLKFKIDPAALK